MNVTEWFKEIVKCRTMTCKYIISRFTDCKYCNCRKCCIKVAEAEDIIIKKCLDRFIVMNKMRVL